MVTPGPPTRKDSSVFIRIYVETMLHYTEEWARSQLAVRALHMKVELQPLLSVTVVIEAPNESDASVSMVLLLDHTTKALSF